MSMLFGAIIISGCSSNDSSSKSNKTTQKVSSSSVSSDQGKNEDIQRPLELAGLIPDAAQLPTPPGWLAKAPE